ncbi:hypothetical protein F4808DRAFT_456234 [Astrocystis sublimbata]|nr:hypothetical protein F4808DRAFT_456234 [Astrocystis sublimbata]
MKFFSVLSTIATLMTTAVLAVPVANIAARDSALDADVAYCKPDRLEADGTITKRQC